MNHPSPRERFAALSDIARNPEWIDAVLQVEKRKGPSSQERCSCGRQNRWSSWCLWCWREMLAVAQGWK